MFAQLFGTPDSFSPARAEPAVPEREFEWNHLIDTIVDEAPQASVGEDYLSWDAYEKPATMRFRNAAGVWESCDAAIEHRDEFKAVVSAPYTVEEGDTVWLEDEQLATLYVVLRSSQIYDGSRLELRAAHIERRQMSRRNDESQGTLEILTNESVESRTVTVNNVSGGGAQIETRDPLADRAPVSLTFRDRVLTGSVRYCRAYQGTYVAGIEFPFGGSGDPA